MSYEAGMTNDIDLTKVARGWAFWTGVFLGTPMIGVALARLLVDVGVVSPLPWGTEVLEQYSFVVNLLFGWIVPLLFLPLPISPPYWFDDLMVISMALTAISWRAQRIAELQGPQSDYKGFIRESGKSIFKLFKSISGIVFIIPGTINAIIHHGSWSLLWKLPISINNKNRLHFVTIFLSTSLLLMGLHNFVNTMERAPFGHGGVSDVKVIRRSLFLQYVLLAVSLVVTASFFVPLM